MAEAKLKILVKLRDEASKQMGVMSGKFRQHSKAIKIAALAAGAAIAAMGIKSVRTFTQMGDEVAKMARRTGFSAESLSELRFAAEQSGASLQMMEKAVKRQSKAIVDATDGMTTYVRAFDRIGLSADELIKLKPEEAFFRIANAIAELESDTVRAATASDIFGRAGMNLIPMFDEGAAAITRYRQQAHELGIVFDELSAKQAEELTDALNTLKRATDGLSIEFAKTFGPAIKTVALSFADLFRAIREGDFSIEASRKFMETFEIGGKAINDMVPDVRRLSNETRILTTEQEQYSDAILESRRRMQELLGVQTKFKAGGGGAFGLWGGVGRVYEAYAKTYGRTTGKAQFEEDYGKVEDFPELFEPFQRGGMVKAKPPFGRVVRVGEKEDEMIIPESKLGRQMESPIQINLVVDGEVLATVVSPHLGASTMKRGRLGG